MEIERLKMDKTQEEIYLYLFRVWKTETTSNKIGNIKEKDNILKEIQFLISKIKESIEKSEKRESVIKKIHEKTLENILFMIKDFFDIRSEKILKQCRLLQKIDEKLLFPAEQEYYKQLYSAFKGASKTKKFLLANIENNNNNNKNKRNNKNNNISTKKKERTQSYQDFEYQETNQDLINKTKPNSIPALEPNEITENIQKLKKNQDVDYILIRFTKNIPALVGRDLKIYGPFNIQDICSLPVQNASILIEENAAIRINPEY